MAALRFLGLQLALEVRSGGGWLVLPPTATGNDRYWSRGDLVVLTAQGQWVLAGSAPKIRLDGLDIALEVERLPLQQLAGTEFRPIASPTSQAVSMRIGASGSPRTMRIGPVLLDDTNSTIGFEATDATALGLYRSDFGFASGSAGDGEEAVWLGLALEKRVGIDLLEKQFTFAPGTLEGRLSARRRPGPFRIAAFANSSQLVVSFADTVAAKTSTWEMALRPGQIPQLNVDPASGSPAIEVLSGCLAVALKRTGGAGALVTMAELRPDQSGQVELRLHALRNSRNRAERWGCAQRIGLAFRTAATGQWHSALVAPLSSKQTPPVLRRLDGVVSNVAGATLPMHSWFGASHFEMPSDATAALMCSEAATTVETPKVAWLDQKLQRRTTRPWLKLRGAVFAHMRPGNAWRGEDNLWRFKTTGEGGAGAPLLSRVSWADGRVDPPIKGSPLFNANREIDDAFREFKLEERQSQHETGMADRNGASDEPPSAPALQQVVPNGDVKAGEIRLQAHARAFAIAAPRQPRAATLASAAPMRLPVVLPEGQAMEFAVAWPALQNGGGKYPWVWLSGLSDWAKAVAGAIDPDAPIAIADLVKDLEFRPKDFPLAILKLTRTQTLDQLFGELAAELKGKPLDSFTTKRKDVVKTIGSVDPAVLNASWVGLALFDVALDFDAFPMLKAVMPSDPAIAPRFAFASVAPRDPQQGGGEVAMSASVDWRNGSGQVTPPSDAQQEATFQPRSLSIAFRDRKLIRFRSEAELSFFSFLGLKAADKGRKKITIVGSAQRVAGSSSSDGAFALRFAAEVPDGGRIAIFPLGKVDESKKTFVKTIWFRRVEIIDAPTSDGMRKAEFDIDGSIEFQKPDFDFGTGDFFQKLSETSVDFRGLRIELDGLNGLDAQRLKIKYPSLRFNIDFPHMALLGQSLKLKFNQLLVDWEKTAGKGFNFGQFPSLGLPSTGSIDLSLPRVILRGRIDFGSLPELFARSLSGFSLDGVFALNFDDNGLPRGLPFIGVGGFGFDRLDLDLLSFLRVRVGRLRLGPAPWAAPPNGSALSLVDASVDVLNYKLLEGGSGAFFSADGESGNGFWGAFKGVDLALFKLEWGFIGQNIDFPKQLPQAILTPPPSQLKEENFNNIAQTIVDAWDSGWIRPGSGSTARGWTFAAGLSAFQGAFRGRALLQDGGFTGLALYGEALRKLLGWNFVFVGIYRRNITPGEDYFYFSVTLPPMSFGGLRFTGGTIAAEIYTSGDFAVDFGFPWRAPTGGRQWERTFGAIVTPGQASGGFYLRKRSSHLPDTGARELTVAGGVAFQWGLGATFGGGVLEVWVRIGLYVIVEGEIVLNYYDTSDVKVVAFKLQGAVGILVEGEGKIDWWVISVRVGVRASAEIRAALIWDGRPGRDNRVLMPIEAELSVSAYAEACIGGGCARICRGIDVHLNIPVRYQLQFG